MQEKYIKVNKPSGVEEYKVLNAFEKSGVQYVVLDSKLKDSNQLTITFVSKVNGDNLEYVEGNEWDSLVKQELIAIVKGNSDSVCFETLDTYQAGEQFAHPLALKDEHINILLNNYQLPVENKVEEVQNPVEGIEEQTPEINNLVEPVINETTVVADAPVEIVEQPIEMPQQEFVQESTMEPVIMEQPQISIEPVISEEPVEETVVNDSVLMTEEVEQVKTTELEELKGNIISLIDKLIEKENELKLKEEQLNNREIEINSIKKDAEVALANAQAKEQVAEIAFNNAQTISQEPDVNGGMEPIIEDGPALTLSQAA